jgi:hypothetical protein
MTDADKKVLAYWTSPVGEAIEPDGSLHKEEPRVGLRGWAYWVLTTVLALIPILAWAVVVVFALLIVVVATKELFELQIDGHLPRLLRGWLAFRPVTLLEYAALSTTVLIVIYGMVHILCLALGKALKLDQETLVCLLTAAGTGLVLAFCIPSAFQTLNDYQFYETAGAHSRAIASYKTHLLWMLVIFLYLAASDLILAWISRNLRLSRMYFSLLAFSDIPTIVGVVIMLLYMSSRETTQFVGGALALQMIVSNTIMLRISKNVPFSGFQLMKKNTISVG